MTRAELSNPDERALTELLKEERAASSSRPETGPSQGSARRREDSCGGAAGCA